MIYILLPAFNEEKNLKIIFQKIKKSFKKKYSFKIIYVRHKVNSGLSLTMETGLKEINKRAKKDDIVISLDSDNTHPVSLMPQMIKKIEEGNDIIIASRFVNQSKVNGLVFWRHFLSIGAKYLFKIIYPYKNLNDYTCNYRAYKFKLLKKILKNKKFFKNEDFNIAAKILLSIITNNKNLKIIELPFTLSYDFKIGQSKMKVFKTILLTLSLLFFKSTG